MLKWFMRKGIAAFERKWDYDASYLREIIDADPLAAWKFSRAAAIGSYRKDVPLAAWTAAAITAVRHEDCGPCTQLGVSMAERSGVRSQGAARDPVRGRRGDARRRGARLAVHARGAGPRSDRARVSPGDRQALGAARGDQPRLRDGGVAHLSDGQIRHGTRPDLLADRRRRRGRRRSARPVAAAAARMTIDPSASFEPYRRRLRGLAYRMLGSMAEAEDAVQDTYLRWHDADRDAVAEPRAFLTTTTTRICLDVLKSARARREEYVGPWLPDPVTDTAALAPDAQTEIAEDLSVGAAAGAREAVAARAGGVPAPRRVRLLRSRRWPTRWAATRPPAASWPAARGRECARRGRPVR